ncbi:hypothetical protein [Bifidobacterium sp.]|jgi:hypothetical protein|uniref:hypothetical protein n=1 Tax=Bifidobacterium sp. TaxID=41200 RepID=UPI0025C253C9|nr:hypothetical protein [Bifidobacterium sp.]MCI1636244.1 hypothetical protein [Bifidobacterium sp.]
MTLAACSVASGTYDNPLSSTSRTYSPYLERNVAPIPQATFGTYYQVFTNPVLAQCVAEILDAKPTDQLWLSTAYETLSLTEIGASNGYDRTNEEHPHCAGALRDSISPEGLDITGLEVFANLEVIDFTGMHHIPDLTPLGGLSNLMHVYLFGTQITSLEPLKRTQWEQKLVVSVEDERVSRLSIPELAQWGILVEGNISDQPKF